MTEASAGHRRATVLDRLAVVATEVMAPIVVAYVVCLAVAIGTTPPLWRGVVVGLTVATLTAGVPFGFVLWESRHGRLSGRHVPELRQRPIVLLIGAASTAFALAASSWLGGAEDVRALVVAVLAGLLIAASISVVWKMSIHVAAAGGAVTALVIVFGVVALPLVVLVLALAWARVRLGAHDVAQVAVGALVGALTTAVMMGALR